MSQQTISMWSTGSALYWCKDEEGNVISCTEEGPEIYHVQIEGEPTTEGFFQQASLWTQGFSSNQKVEEVSLLYQSVVKDADKTFDDASQSALQLHQEALGQVDKDPKKALSTLGKCRDLAKKMEIATADMIDKLNALTGSVSEALLSVTRDETGQIEERKKIQKTLQAHEVKSAELRARVSNLNTQKEAAQAEINRMYAAVPEVAMRAIGLEILCTAATFGLAHGAVTRLALQPLVDRVNLLSSQMKELEGQRDNQQKNLELEQEKLSQKQSQIGKLTNAIDFLGRGIQALGSVRTAFENTRIFWMHVREECTNLGDMGLLELQLEKRAKQAFKDDFTRNVEEEIAFIRQAIEAKKKI